MKILYTASTISHIHAFHMDYISALRSEGHEVLVMASGEGADYNIPFEKKLFAKANRLAVREIRAILDADGFDLVILNTSLAAFHIRRAIRKRHNLRVINIVHGYLFPLRAAGLRAKLRRALLLLAEKIMKSKTDMVLVMNEEDRIIAEKYNLAKEDVIMTLGMGIPPLEPTSGIDIRQATDSQASYVMLFVGELSNRKNQEFIIRALPALKEKIPNIKLWLLGDGDNMEYYRSLSTSLGVEGNLTLFGRQKNVADYISACDLYVSASKIEGLPFNIVEALGLGATVLASDIKGHRDILGEGAGVLFELDSDSDFIEKAIQLHDGEIKPSENDKELAYSKYTASNVFSYTYEKIKKAGGI